MEYALKYDFIVSTLCENRDIPEMECNGKCYLGKQLAKENGDQEDNPFQKSFQTEISFNLISEEVIPFSFGVFSEEIEEAVFYFSSDFYRSITSQPLIQPPQLSLS